MKKKTIESVVLGKPTIGILYIMSQGLMDSFNLLLKEYECLPQREGYYKVDRVSIKMQGIMMSNSILLPFICELGLTALYLLDYPEEKNIPRSHSLLSWWNKLKEDTRKKVIQKFEEVKGKKETPEKILKFNDKSHTEWRYWWRKGFATGGPSSISMQHLTNIIINLIEVYLRERGDRELQPETDGHKAFDKARKTRNMN